MTIDVTMGLGTAAAGNLYKARTDEQVHDLLDAAWQVGIRYFDTAPHYGLGLAERRLGAFLAGHASESFVVSTKVGRVLEESPGTANFRDDQQFDVPAALVRRWDPSADGVRRSVEDSLSRLGLDAVDTLLLHDPDEHDLEAALGTAVPAMRDLVAEGLARRVGVGARTLEGLTYVARHHEVDVLMLGGRYTLLEREAEDELLPLCAERGVAVIAAAPFNSGLLSSTHPQHGAKYEYEAAPAPLVARAGALAAICEQHGATLPAAAVQFPLRHPVVESVVMGADSAEQVRENAARAASSIDHELWPDLASERCRLQLGNIQS